MNVRLLVKMEIRFSLHFFLFLLSSSLSRSYNSSSSAMQQILSINQGAHRNTSEVRTLPPIFFLRYVVDPPTLPSALTHSPTTECVPPLNV